MPTDNGDSGHPWDIEAQWHEQAGLTSQEARDIVAYRWLSHGDIRALAAFLRMGHVPGPKLLKLLSFVLVDPDIDSGLPQNFAEVIPYHLVLKRRLGKGRSHNPENDVRDALTAANIRDLISAGKTYEGAVGEMLDRAEEWGARIGEKTMRNAYDRAYGKKKRI